MDSNLIQGNLSSTNVAFTHEPGSTYASSQRIIDWYVVEIPGASVQRGNTALSGDTTSSISSVNTSSTFHWSSGWNTGGGQTYANHMYTINLSDSTTLQFDKQTGSQTQNINWQVITIPDYIPILVEWNQSTLALGSGLITGGNLSGNVTITSARTNNNILVGCESGNCSFITDNWIDGTSLAAGASQELTFNCFNTSIAVLSAVFNVTSTEDNSPD